MRRPVKRDKKAVEEHISHAYLTKRATASAARRGFIEAAKETMEIVGYNVIAKDGYIVKINKEGEIIEIISSVPNYNIRGKIHLD